MTISLPDADWRVRPGLDGLLAALGAAMSDLSARKLIIVGVIAAVMSFALTYTFTDVLSVVLPE